MRVVRPSSNYSRKCVASRRPRSLQGRDDQETGQKALDCKPQYLQFVRILATQLTTNPAVVPDFAVCCRRLTPGPGYLEALCENNASRNASATIHWANNRLPQVDFVPSEILAITSTGIETADGKHTDLDVIICATGEDLRLVCHLQVLKSQTGFDTSFHFDFDVIGRNGRNLRDHYTPHPRTYLAVATEGFPNWFQALGPNAAVGAGSLLILMEKQVEYAVEATLKLQRERLKSMEIKAEAVDDFDEYLDVSQGAAFLVHDR